MRHIRYIFTILSVLLLLTYIRAEVLAIDTGFATETLPEKNINSFLKYIKLSMITEEPRKIAIDCFDVNEKGEIAIGRSEYNNKTVCIYTSDGDFQYGYSFFSQGSFGVELNNDILLIYFVRSDIVIAVNPMGEIESILGIKNTIENNSYWNNFVHLTKRKIGDTEYTIRNDMGFFNLLASSYSQLVITDKNGNENIIYDVNSAQFSYMLKSFINKSVIVCIVMGAIICQLVIIYRKH